MAVTFSFAVGVSMTGSLVVDCDCTSSHVFDCLHIHLSNEVREFFEQLRAELTATWTRMCCRDAANCLWTWLSFAWQLRLENVRRRRLSKATLHSRNLKASLMLFAIHDIIICNSNCASSDQNPKRFLMRIKTANWFIATLGKSESRTCYQEWETYWWQWRTTELRNSQARLFVAI